MASPGFAFAAIGLNHGHIYGQTQRHARRRLPAEVVLRAGGRSRRRLCRRRFRDARRVADERAILEDPEIQLVVGAGILADRAPMAVRAMRHGKDVMLDKPGATTLEQLAELRARAGRDRPHPLDPLFRALHAARDRRRRRAGQGRARSAACSRRSASGRTRSATTRAPTGSGSRERTGGILCDIGSHQVEQFLFFTGAEKAEVVASHVANFDHPDNAGVRGFRRRSCSRPTTRRASSASTGSRRTACRSGATGGSSSSAPRARSSCENTSTSPAGRAAIISSSSTGRARATSTAPATKIVYGEQLRDDVLNRTETAMTQSHCFYATELALTAQAKATRIAGKRPQERAA